MGLRIFSSFLMLLSMSGCAYMSGTYGRLEAPNAVYFGRHCWGTIDPKSVIYYPFHGILISVDIDGAIRFGIHLPAGTTAEVVGRTIRIVGRTEVTPIDFTAQIQPTTIGSFGSVDPWEFRAFFRGPRSNSPPAQQPLSFGPFEGASKDGRHIWYLFSSFDESQTPPRFTRVPTGLVEGTVELPALSINGQRHPPQTLRVRQSTYGGVFPINC
jgi:hypothetical protein